MTTRDWIRAREIQGLVTFSYEDVIKAFPTYTAQHIRNDLYRHCKAGIIAQVYRGFYVVIPPHYASKGIVPPIYYIDQLMSYLKRPYYVSLLSAAELLGAAHQRPQTVSVCSVFPKQNFKRESSLVLNYRSSINDNLLLTRNSETGTIRVSCPELTSLDLVQYEQHIGGLSRAATVIEELSEQADWKRACDNGLFQQATLSAVQRLGYILENVLQNHAQADILYSELKKRSPKFNRFPLSIRKDVEGAQVDKRWSILVNTEIEIDDGFFGTNRDLSVTSFLS